MISKTIICSPEEFDAKYKELELALEKEIKFKSENGCIYYLKDNPTIQHHGDIHYIQFIEKSYCIDNDENY